MKNLYEEDIVSGDHGGDPENIASGETTGNFVNSGPSNNKKKDKKKKRLNSNIISRIKEE